MFYGYARCSTNENKQDINRQVRELKAAGAKKIFVDYEHGNSDIKKELDLFFDTAKEGDTLITAEVSRLSRSTQQLCGIVEKIKDKKLRLIILGSITVDCRSGEIDPISNAFLQMSGVFAELERAMIVARVKSGIENARAKGIILGRPRLNHGSIPQKFFHHYPDYKAGNLTITDLARLCRVSRPTLYGYIEWVERKKT
jgi:DNA invertase Pin-like site-specific DNA recombinase